MGKEKEDTFFTQRYCDRCGKDLGFGRIMSMFNTDCICMQCNEEEKALDNFDKAKAAEEEAVKNGDLNFCGIDFL